MYKGHPFGNLVEMHLGRKPGLSKAWLSREIDVDPAVITHMCQGRRLTDRSRILEIVRCFHSAGVLESKEEATALLEAAGLRQLVPEDGIDLPAGAMPHRPNREIVLDVRQPHLGRWALVVAAVVLLVSVGVVLSVGLRCSQDGTEVVLTEVVLTEVVWQETFDPMVQSQWAQVTARWDDVSGPTAVLVENNPDEDFGKVESEVITVGAGLCPVLLVDVTAVDPHTSYTIQILDKRTGDAVDVLKSINYPGGHTVDLASAMGWREQDSQDFTINVWIGGKGGIVTFDRVAVVIE